MTKENFKAIGFKNYSVSNLGNVRNDKTQRILSVFVSSGGYLQVNLGVDPNTGKQYVPLIHKLVADAFVPNPNNYPIINHKDENKLNNEATNLEWCDYLYNCNYGSINEKRSTGLKGNQNAKGMKYNKNSKIRYVYIYEGKEYSLKDLLKVLDCSKSKITEQFRRNFGLVKNGKLTRKKKGE